MSGPLLCTILSNALENALHALEHTSGEKWISLHIMQRKIFLLLEIKNPIETMPKFIDGIPISDKKVMVLEPKVLYTMYNS